MDNREVAGVRRAITWLHEEAKTMNDPNAVTVLNNAAFHLGVQLSKWRGDVPSAAMRLGLTAVDLERAEERKRGKYD